MPACQPQDEAGKTENLAWPFLHFDAFGFCSEVFFLVLICSYFAKSNWFQLVCMYKVIYIHILKNITAVSSAGMLTLCLT